MSHQGRTGVALVFWRELKWLTRRPLLLLFMTVIPIGLMLVLALIFSAGVATKLPVAVLDQDHSGLSQEIIRKLNATPDVEIRAFASELSEGKRLILSGQIYGLLVIPNQMQRDVLAGNRPEVVFFYNSQTMTTGNLVLRGVRAALQNTSAELRVSVRAARGQSLQQATSALSPIPVQTHALFNPTLDYTHFLLAALIPSLLQIVIVTSSSYVTGIDVESRHRLRILRRLGGGLLPALCGKLLAHNLVFLVVLCIADVILLKVFHMPLRGSIWLLFVANVVFILACQLMGSLLALLLKPASGAVGVGTLLTAPAFGFMGIGFPRLAMGSFAYFWGGLMPGTWFLMIRIDQTIRGTPLAYSLQTIAVLMAFVLVLSILIVLRLSAIRRQNDTRTSLVNTDRDSYEHIADH